MPFPRPSRTGGGACNTARRRRRHGACRSLVVGAAIVAALATSASATDIDLSVSAHYSSGDYGEDANVDIVYVPAVMRVETGAWLFKAVVPFVRISGGSTTVELPTGPVTTRGGTSQGLGDVALEGSYAISPLFEHAPFLDLNTRIKLPSADEDQGLGTGEYDFAWETELARSYGNWTPFVSAGFRVLGDSSSTTPRGVRLAVTYRDGFFASAGALYLVRGWVEPGLFVYWKEAATKGSDQSLELLPVLRLYWSESWVVEAYASAGFTDSTPDAGVGLEIHYRILDAFAD